MTVIESLPDRPLTNAEIVVLDQSDTFVMCSSVFGWQGVPSGTQPTDSVVAIYMVTQNQAYLLGFDPDAGEWARVGTISEPTEDAFDVASEELHEWLSNRYDKQSLVVLEDDEEVTEDQVLDFFPESPVGKDITDLEDLPGIDEVYPLFCLKQSHAVIVVSVGTFGSMFILGFDADVPDEAVAYTRGDDLPSGEWTVLSRTELTLDDDPSDEDMADFIELQEWLEQRYPEDELLGIDPDSVRDR